MDRHTYSSFGNLLGMLLVRGYDRSERILAAMKCRGFQGRFYLLDHFCFQARDVIFCLVSVLICCNNICRGVPMTEPLIYIRDVEFSYSPDRPVLGGCNFRLEPGQRMALTGATAAAKPRLCI